jgi:hypothetical protein
MPLASFQPRTNHLAVRWQMDIEPLKGKTQKNYFPPHVSQSAKRSSIFEDPNLGTDKSRCRHPMGLTFKNVDVEIDLRYVGISPLVSWNLGLMNPIFESDGRSSTNRG